MATSGSWQGAGAACWSRSCSRRSASHRHRLSACAGEPLPPEACRAGRAIGGAGGKDVAQRSRRPADRGAVEPDSDQPAAEAVTLQPETHGGLLAFMVFSLFVGIAVASLPAEAGGSLIRLCRSLFAVAMKIIDFAMRLAPLSVACLGFSVTALLGPSILRTLGYYVLVVIGGLALQQFVTYSLALAWVARKSPRLFFRQSREAIVMAFATASATRRCRFRCAWRRRTSGCCRASRASCSPSAPAPARTGRRCTKCDRAVLAQVFGVELTVAKRITVAVMCIIAGRHRRRPRRVATAGRQRAGRGRRSRRGDRHRPGRRPPGHVPDDAQRHRRSRVRRDRRTGEPHEPAPEAAPALG